MVHVLRQIAVIFLVTLVTMSVTVSSGNAAMKLECDMMLSAASVSDGDHVAKVGSDHASMTPAPAKGDAHEGDPQSDAKGDHCDAQACPATAYLASSATAPAFLIGQRIDVIRAAALVDLMIPEGLRRPPRA